MRLSKSAVAFTPGSVCSTRKMLSAAPAMLRTCSGLTSIVAGGRAIAGAVPLTVTSSLNCERLSRTTSIVTGCADATTSTCSAR